MNKTSRTIKILIGVAVLAVTVSAANYLLFAEIRKKNENISKLSNEIQLELKRERRLQAMQDLVEDTQQKRNRLDSYFVGEEAIVDFLEQIEAVGDDVGAPVTVNSVSVNETESDVSYEELRVSLTTEGSWQNVFHLFALLESLPYSIEVKRAQLSKNERSATDSDSADSEEGEEDVSGDMPPWEANFVFSIAKLK